MKSAIYLISLIAAVFSGCQQKKLPILSEPDVVIKVVDGKRVEETVYPVIPDFTFKNQYGETVTQKVTDGKIYVADFFFTTCPTICPVMKKNMLRVYEAYRDEPQVGILSHTIDPEHDTVEVLQKYAADLGVTGKMWQFLTGDRDRIYEIAEKHYLVSARKDPNEPGGYIHSGAFVLIDKQKHVRGFYDGTNEQATRQLVRDINTLLKE